MKTIRNLFFATAIVASLLSSCSKDDEETSIKGTVKVDDKSFPVDNATIQILSSMGDMTITVNLIHQISSTDIESINVILSSEDESAEGVYTTTDSEKKLEDFGTSISTVDEDGNYESVMLEDGSFTIKDNGDKNYTVDLDFEMVGGKKVTGSYTGEFVSQTMSF